MVIPVVTWKERARDCPQKKKVVRGGKRKKWFPLERGTKKGKIVLNLQFSPVFVLVSEQGWNPERRNGTEPEVFPIFSELARVTQSCDDVVVEKRSKKKKR